jgi:hypothetical protein
MLFIPATCQKIGEAFGSVGRKTDYGKESGRNGMRFESYCFNWFSKDKILRRKMFISFLTSMQFVFKKG